MAAIPVRCPGPSLATLGSPRGARTPLRAVSPKPSPSWRPGRANPPRKRSQIPPVPPLRCGQSSAPHHARIPPGSPSGTPRHRRPLRAPGAEQDRGRGRPPRGDRDPRPPAARHRVGLVPHSLLLPGVPPPGAPPVRTRPAARPLRPGPAAFFCLVWPEPGRPGRDEGPGTAPVALQHLGPSRRPVPGRAAPPAPQCPRSGTGEARASPVGGRPSGGGSPLPPAPSSGELWAAPTGREGPGGNRSCPRCCSPDGAGGGSGGTRRAGEGAAGGWGARRLQEKPRGPAGGEPLAPGTLPGVSRPGEARDGAEQSSRALR